MARLSTDRYDLPLENTYVIFQARMVRSNILGDTRLDVELQLHLMGGSCQCMRTYDILLTQQEAVNLLADITAATQRIDDIQSGKGAKNA